MPSHFISLSGPQFSSVLALSFSLAFLLLLHLAFIGVPLFQDMQQQNFTSFSQGGSFHTKEWQ